jgi:hypothetical protein
MATTHIVIIKEKYYCAYIPSARSQKYAFDEVRGEIKVSVPSVTADEAPVAFRLSDYHHTSEQIDEIRWWGGRLWSKSTYRHTGGPELVVEHLKADDLRGELRPSLPYGHSRNRGLCVKKYREEAKDMAECEEDVLSYALFPQVASKFFASRHQAPVEAAPVVEKKVEDPNAVRELYVQDLSK